MGCQRYRSAAGPECHFDRSYGIVRHPMYSGGVLMIFATPLALGSLSAFVCAVLLCGVIAARLLDEERYLSRNFPVTRTIAGRFDTD